MMISVLVIVWAVVVALDIVSTLIGVNRGLREATPWLRKILGEDDYCLFGMRMLLLGIVVCWSIVGLYHWQPWAGYLLGLAAIAWRGVVVYMNFRLIRRVK
jgi:hypothetical protein